MNKKRAYVIGVVIAILFLIAGGVWFWSVGSVAAEKLPAIRVQAEHQPVEYKHKADTQWTALSDVIEVSAGDSVRTGDGGEASIVWGDEGVTRLDAGTELEIAEAPSNGSGATSSAIRLKLTAGRVWSRMLKLLDANSSMEVGTTDVVATVRGTSFGIAKVASATEAAVSESVVNIHGTAVGGDTLLTDNRWGRFDANGKPEIVRTITDADTWVADEKQKDIRFDRDYMKDLRKRFDDRAQNIAHVPEWILNASESAHLALANGDARQSLATDYAKRRLALSVIDPSRATTELLHMRTLLPDMGAKAGLMRGELHAASSFLARARFPGLRDEISTLALPQRLTNDNSLSEIRLLRDSVGDSTPSWEDYRELVRIDEGVDDYLEGVLPEGGRMNALADLGTRLDRMDAKLKTLDEPALNQKSAAIRARLTAALGMTPPPAVEINPADNPGINVTEPAFKPPVLKAPTTKTPTTQPPVGRVYVRLSLLASPSTPIGNQAATLKLFGIRANGQAEEITSSASFYASNNSDGTMQGNIFLPILIGTINLNANYTDALGMRTVATSINHVKSGTTSKDLSSIELRFTAPTTVTCSATLPYKVFAIYGDGSSKDVTISSRVTVSDSKLLFPGDMKILTYCSGVTATGTVTASYTEQNVTKTTNATITVVPDTGSTSKPRYRYTYP